MGPYFLSRLGYNAGAYLALTGSRIKAQDAIFLGTATNFVHSKNFNDIIGRRDFWEIQI